MKRFSAILLLIVMISCLALPNFTVMADEYRFQQSFDNLTTSDFTVAVLDKERKENFAHSDKYIYYGDGLQKPKVELSTEQNHTNNSAPGGKSVKVSTVFTQWKGVYTGTRIKFFNIFKNSALTKEDIGKSFNCSFWVYSLNDVTISVGIMSVENTSTMSSATQNGYGGQFYDSSGKAEKVFNLVANTWTECKFDYTLDEINVDPVYQVGMLAIVIPSGTAEKGDTIYIDDIDVKSSSSANLPTINTGANDTDIKKSNYDLKFGEEYSEIGGLMSNLGLMGDLLSSFKADEKLTRAAFAKALCGFTGVTASNTATSFSDVPSTHSASAEIKIMTDLGIMKGFNDGTFKPDNNIAYVDAVTALLSFLGYDVSAEKIGGYPIGYMIVAQNEGLTKGIKMGESDEITQGTFLKLINNFIGIDTLEKVNFGDRIEYEAKKGNTILARNFNIYKGTGRVTGNPTTMLSGESRLASDAVMIDNTVYKIGKTETDKYLGYGIKYYYIDDQDDDLNLVFSKIDSTKNDKITIKAEDIISFSNGKLTYNEESGKSRKEVKVDFNSDFIYNGLSASADDSFFDLDEGNVVFLDYDRNGTYETIFINEIEYYVVAGIDTYEKVIYGKYGKENIEVEPEGKKVKLQIKNTENSNVDFSKIENDSILSVIRSSNSSWSYIDIVVSNYIASGKVEEISKTSDGKLDTITIGGQKYQVTNTMNALMSDTFTSLNVGEVIDLYLNNLGSAVSWEISQKNVNDIGFVMSSGFKNGIDKRLELKILTKANTISIYPLAKKINFNGDMLNSDNNYVISSLHNVRQVICYTLNNDNEINKITTSKEDGDIINGDLYKVASRLTLYCRGSYMQEANVNGQQFNLAGSVIVFRIPVSEEFIDDDSYYQAAKGSTILSSGNYEFDGYTLTGNYNNLDVMVVYRDTFYVRNIYLGTVMLVNKVTRVLDNDGDEIQKITGMSGVKEVSITLKDTRKKKSNYVTPGDVIQYIDNKGVVELSDKVTEKFRFLVDYDSTNKYAPITEVNQVYTDATYFSNVLYPYDINDGYILLNKFDKISSNKPLRAYDAGVFATYVFDTQKNQVRKGTFNEVVTYKMNSSAVTPVFTNIIYKKPDMLVIYK